MNYKKAIQARLGDMAYSTFAKEAKINPSGFHQSMKKNNPDFGWKQLLKISKALGIGFPTLAREAIKYEGDGDE